MPGGRPEMIYVPQEYLPQVEAHLGNLAEVREVIEEICEINRELLRLREEL
jgi:hypothetical protein